MYCFYQSFVVSTIALDLDMDLDFVLLGFCGVIFNSGNCCAFERIIEDLVTTFTAVCVAGLGGGLPDKLIMGAGATSGDSTPPEERDIPNELVNKGVVNGSVELWDRLYPNLKGKCPAGIGEMVWAHYDAPMKAMKGDGAGAVGSVTSAVGALAGGIIGSIGGPAGIAAGMVVGKLISEAPVGVINYMDTTNVEFRVRICNLSGHTISFTEPDAKNYYSTSFMSYDVDVKNQIGNNQMHKCFIPPAMNSTKEGTDYAEASFWTIILKVKSKFASASFHLEAKDADGKRVKTYDIAFQYPGDWAGYKHYVGVFEDAGWDHTGNTTLEKMGHAEHCGKERRPGEGTSGMSVGYWGNWGTCVFELG